MQEVAARKDDVAPDNNRQRGKMYAEDAVEKNAKLTSCGLAFTEVARSFCVIDLPSGLSLAIRAVASALPTLNRGQRAAQSDVERDGAVAGAPERTGRQAQGKIGPYTYEASTFSGGLGASSRSSLAILPWSAAV